ncbi:hypothetical protein TRFO_02685 [Tritrichomonas foetus]|uniref:USP domain-containing protein n=1 Tax=Tritrichomonas foetus TaxID=1144522 RepID=A0A1J4L3E1_9EUKA|nr:hypothetical protein TRFO_02685 [Tritrichomonas foetus]|eukprot:OHT16429.1 hypothetical protein TRFO_02685 [Tritrichomonas foetus]
MRSSKVNKPLKIDHLKTFLEMGEIDLSGRYDSFLFTLEEGESVSKYGLSIKPFKIGAHPFVACVNIPDSTLTVFLCSSQILSDREKRRYIFELRTENIEFSSTVQFSKRQPFVTFPNITIPFFVRISNIPVTSGAHYGGGLGGLGGGNARQENTYTNPYVPYVGIDNLGVTCYIASSLQFLFTVTPFLSLIFSKTELKENSVSLELQKIFCDYLNASSTIHIRQFVSSFGTSSYEMSFREQDSHEFILQLFDKLDKENGKDFENLRNEIFGVHSLRITECEEVNVKQQNQEFSNDIELPVQGFNSIYESLQYLTEEESFVGENQWDTGTEHGKKDAIRYLRYNKLPPFLIFNLYRYRYNERSQSSEEVRTKYDCPETLDMRPYCTDDIETETQYKMVAIVAHRGNPQSGHYIAFTQPQIDGRWFEFNDSNVSLSSFNEVKDTFGGRDNTFMRLWSYIVGNFIAYIVGYVRIDCIESFKQSPRVPLSIAPHLSTSYMCKLIYSDEIESSQIYGSGKSLVWEEDDKTFDELFERKDFSIFVSLPQSDHLIGPIPRTARASDFTVKGFEANFIGIPSDKCDCPVFFINDDKYVGVYNKNELIPTFKHEFEFRHEGIPVDESSLDSIYPGSIIFGVPLSNISIKINKKEYQVDPNMSYNQLQLLLTNNDTSKASQLLFYGDYNNRNTSNNSNNANSNSNLPSKETVNKNVIPLRPRKFPNALALHMMGELDAKLLESPATANSLDLFTPLNIDLYDIGHTKYIRKNSWFPKDSTVAQLIEKLPGWFDFKPDNNYNYIVSYNQEHAIASIYEEDQKIKSANIRIDVLKCPFPRTLKEINMMILEDSPMTAIEVRTMTYEQGFPKFQTMGIYVLTKSSTANSIAKSLFKNNPLRVMIRGTKDFFKGYQIEGRDNLIRLLEQLAEKREWLQERPIIVFQLNERKPDEMPQF